MELLTQLLSALWSQDFETLANPSMIGMLYFVLFMILFLENGILPAAFLPGDSLLVLVGVLIAKGAMGFPETIALLTIAASLGSWLGYIQGALAGKHPPRPKLAVASAGPLSPTLTPAFP
ncbi:Inner membrane protein YqjA [Cedecea neteri]|uniref:Inner membrane protein YqjA n=1 Tax=Cedecea neteri TaxID=158822 RepID=A0A2X2V6W6_9ENTR|nr:Inner membrane protein YqjA [Cedecea neteri]